ncbi:porin family protein [Flavobacterium sp.]|uniref:porin family protein n=1 Tax=Flavobacterium sp. TaxID=239 RepID=UPI00260B62F2|nr:porin family protein [Flavobacterium sp.]
MKSLKILGTMVFAVFVQSAVAQDSTTPSSSFNFGVKGGLNYATVTGDEFDSPDARTSFHVGALAEFPITSRFALQIEAVYSSQGFESEFDGFGGGANDKIEYQLDYINVPVLAKIYLLKGLSIEAGPQFGFKANEEIDTDPNNNPGDFEIDQAADYDFSVVGGLTFKSDAGFFLYGRYNYGLTDIIEDVDVKNSVLQVGVGFQF